MPVPFMPVLLRIGAAAAAGYALARWIAARTGEGRRDQRAEDALDALDEGFLLHGPARTAPRDQRNATLRLRRVFGFRGREWEFDAGLIARLRLRARRDFASNSSERKKGNG
ncbi:hypothetical protein [Pseudogemmobacter bohemicus]|uniref:hypothetical protein n=1 Tax=Pseudogemmobacter bohemicus TaxID=2250708 RepID=UPI000DD37A2C|nr:hypothetical protein [Pseudogemmobacter bohemicus]